MAQNISQGSIFGRIGSGIGKGLAEQLPEEINRGRLASGLKNFELEHQDLNPMQQLARLSSIPGVTPQMIQSFSELARINNQKNAYGNRTGQNNYGGRPMRSSPDLSEVQQANLLDQAANAGNPIQKQFNPTAQGGLGAASAGLVKNNQRTPNVLPEQTTAEIANQGAINERALARTPWTPDQRDSRVNEYLNQGFLVDQAKELAADDEARDIGEAGALEKREEQLRGKSEKARSELRRQLETKLEKSGEETFKDVSGEMLINAERGMERDLRTNPKLTEKDAANDWSNRLLNVAKAKDRLRTLGATTGIESIIKGNQVLDRLRSYEDIFKKAGNSEEYYNLLKTNFGLSPQGAATIAFPLSKESSSNVNRYKPDKGTSSPYGLLPNVEKIESNARRAAIEIAKNISPDDSILTIARALSDKDPDFDQEAFFSQLEQDKDIISLNNRQRQELTERSGDRTPTWGDIKIFPWFRRAHK